MTDELSFDPDAFELRQNGALAELEPQAISVAAYLIEHRHRLIPKEELLDEVWGDRFVSESALTTRIKQIRRALGDSGAEQRVVKTVHGKGYRFVGDISITSSQPNAAPSGEDAEAGTSEQPLHSLPRPRTEMIGRSEELGSTIAALERHRLTTMVGVGGVGKTTVAVAVGRASLDTFADGVWFVDLVPVTDGEQIPLALAKAAGLSLRTGPALEQLSSIIEQRDMLFIIDNCEHVIDSVASTVDRLLDTTTGPRFLLTSREPLGLLDEARVVVDTLSTAESDGPAVALLAACAARFGVADLDPAVAGQMCRELDGLPLAIELAAAQLRHLSLDDLAARLDARFELLVGPRRDRHASLAAVLDATWASISDRERQILRQLAVCPAPLSLDDVIEIMAQPEAGTLAGLARLVDCSLLIRSTDSDQTYRMLESVRVYARSDDPDHHPARRDRLAEWCLERVGTNVLTHALDFGLASWCRAHDNVLDVAEAHLGARRPNDAALLVAAQALAMHIDDGSRAAEILSRLDQHLARVDDSSLRARLHITGAFGAMAARDSALLASHGQAAVDEARHAQDASMLSISLVLHSWSFGRQPIRAIELIAEAVQISDAAGDQRSFDLAEGYRAWHLAIMRHHDEAVEVARKVLDRGPENAGYDTACAAAALATCLAPGDPTEALGIVATWLDPSVFSSMMANQLLTATAFAADGDVDRTTRTVLALSRRLERAGVHALPDALIPASMLAASLGDDNRAREYIAAVRRSERPTQSLQATCLYQQLRDRLDEPGRRAASDDARSSEDVGRDALDWLATLTEPRRGPNVHDVSET